ncbi:MAG: hypothetical protein WC464_00980 [Bdellovibrionales bacterium]
MTEEKNEAKKSALGIFAEIPKIGVLGGDILLGYSHRQALEIAAETLADISPKTKTEIIKAIFEIFEQWKDERGVYPPNEGWLFGLAPERSPKTQEPAKDYCNRILMAAKLSGKKAQTPEPWECCPYVQTPVGLFWRLLGDEYSPLLKYLKYNPLHYEIIIALLILISDKPKAESQSGDCIDSALKLARYRLEIQKEDIRRMTPDAIAAFNRRKQKRLRENAQKENTKKIILLAFQKLISEGEKPSLKELKSRTGKSEPVVCRCLKEAGIDIKGKKKFPSSTTKISPFN